MIVLSLILVILAAVALVAGIFQGGLELVYASIGACVLAMVLLGVGVLVRRRSAPRPSAAAYGPGASSSAQPAPATGGTGPSGAPSASGQRRVVRRHAAEEDSPAAQRPATDGAATDGPTARRAVTKKAVTKKAVTGKAAANRPSMQAPSQRSARPLSATDATGWSPATAADAGTSASTGRTTGAAARSALAQIKGVGPAKQEALLSAFPSLEAIRDAPVRELSEVQGIGPSVARRVKDALS